MKLILMAFLLSITFHLLFLFPLTKKENKQIDKIEKTEKKSTEITYVKLKKKEEPKKVQIEEPKKIEKTKIAQKPEKTVKTKTKPKEKTKKTATIKKTKPKKEVPKKQIEKTQKLQNRILQDQIVNKQDSIQSRTLEDFLSQSDKQEEQMINQVERLYGREFETFTKVQKAFIKKNLNKFQAITQRVLNQMGYPYIARKMRLAGSNQVSFLFHPNGDISNLRITKSSGYSIFDDYTLDLIKIAYKDYPKPKTATKLIFDVNYRLY